MARTISVNPPDWGVYIDGELKFTYTSWIAANEQAQVFNVAGAFEVELKPLNERPDPAWVNKDGAVFALEAIGDAHLINIFRMITGRRFCPEPERWAELADETQRRESAYLTAHAGEPNARWHVSAPFAAARVAYYAETRARRQNPRIYGSPRRPLFQPDDLPTPRTERPSPERRTCRSCNELFWVNPPSAGATRPPLSAAFNGGVPQNCPACQKKLDDLQGLKPPSNAAPAAPAEPKEEADPLEERFKRIELD